MSARGPEKPGVCDHCAGDLGATYRKWQRFCSPKCRDDWHTEERKAARTALRKRRAAAKRATKPRKKHAPRVSVGAEATVMLRQLMERDGLTSPTKAVAGLLTGEIAPLSAPGSHGKARGGSGGV